MKRQNIALFVVVDFILFFFVLPEIFTRLDMQNNFLFALFRLLSIIPVPILMYNSFNYISIVKRVSISLFLVSFGFFLFEFSNGDPNAFFRFFLSVFIAIVLLSSLYLFVVGLTLEPTFYFRRRVGTALVLTAILLILRYSGIINLVIAVIADYSSTSYLGWDIGNIYLIAQNTVFILYFVFQYLVLDGIIAERNKYY